MPSREITLKRWQAVGVLVLLTLSYVLAVLLVGHEGSVRAAQVESEARARTAALSAHTRSVDKRLCQGTVDNREAVRSTWNAARAYILRGDPPPAQEAATDEFFDLVLATIPPLECAGSRPIPKSP